MERPLIIGTRGSKLALAQAEWVAAALRQQHPGLQVELRIITTQGDRVLDVALAKVGDKGLFVKEIEIALLQGEIDVAVHSGKDLPSQVPAELVLTAFPQRADPRDALVLPHRTEQPDYSLETLPAGALVGTSSLRRSSQLRALRPDLRVQDVRGNVGTRLRKLDEGLYDALLLAAAGLLRLGLGERISRYLDPTTMLPAVAQGALAVETRADDSTTRNLLAALDDPATRAAVLAERACLRRLEGGCQVPIAAHAELQPSGALWLRGLVAALDGSALVQREDTGSSADPEALGSALAEDLLRSGAAPLLEAQRTAEAQPQASFAAPPPLHGWRVVVTRAEVQADSINRYLRQMGAEPVAYPTIAFAPPLDSAPLDSALDRLRTGGYEWLVLTSATGVRAVKNRLDLLAPGAASAHLLPDTLQLAAVGPATADACRELLGSAPAVVPDTFVAEELAAALGALQGQRVLLAQAEQARPVLRDRLLAAGAQVDAVVAYRTVAASDDDSLDMPATLARGEVHAITFTSGSTVRHFVERIGPHALPHARRAVIACIGPVTARVAEEVGLPPTLVAQTSTVEGLVDALAAWRQQQAPQAT